MIKHVSISRTTNIDCLPLKFFIHAVVAALSAIFHFCRDQLGLVSKKFSIHGNESYFQLNVNIKFYNKGQSLPRNGCTLRVC